MSFDLEKILESKRAKRRNLASRSVAEKLRLLDAMRERELAIRRGTTQADSGEPSQNPLPQNHS